MNHLNEWLVFAQTRQSILDNPSLKNLLDNYKNLKRKVPNPPNLLHLKKLLAELCFLIAQEYKSVDQEKTQHFAEQAINIYKDIKIDSLEEAAPILDSLLPDLMHEGVVLERIIKH